MLMPLLIDLFFFFHEVDIFCGIYLLIRFVSFYLHRYVNIILLLYINEYVDRYLTNIKNYIVYMKIIYARPERDVTKKKS